MAPWVCDFTRNTSPVGEIQDVYLCLWSDIMLCFDEMAPWVCDFTRNTSPVGEIQDVYLCLSSDIMSSSVKLQVGYVADKETFIA